MWKEVARRDVSWRGADILGVGVSFPRLPPAHLNS